MSTTKLKNDFYMNKNRKEINESLFRKLREQFKSSKTRFERVTLANVDAYLDHFTAQSLQNAIAMPELLQLQEVSTFDWFEFPTNFLSDNFVFFLIEKLSTRNFDEIILIFSILERFLSKNSFPKQSNHLFLLAFNNILSYKEERLTCALLDILTQISKSEKQVKEVWRVIALDELSGHLRQNFRILIYFVPFATNLLQNSATLSFEKVISKDGILSFDGDKFIEGIPD